LGSPLLAGYFFVLSYTMQHQITNPGKLLNANGSLREPGWGTDLLLEYNRADIQAAKWRIKEWDYYAVLNESYGLAFTVSDNGYLGLVSVTFFDFVNGTETSDTILTPLPMGKYKLPNTTAKGDVHFKNKRFAIDYLVKDGARQILCTVKNFKDGQDLSADITLQQPPMDTMVIATPWKESPKAFYYNQKMNCLRASGKATLGSQEFIFRPETDFATFDWGRGVWTYKNTWYWGSGNGIVNGKTFGFNIGYGFGDTAAATENMLFYDGKAHKLDQIQFHIPKESYLKPWRFSSNDGRFEMDFLPILDRASTINALVISTDQHQVFGRISGKAILDNGEVLHIKDMLCFAEEVSNKF
jgi:hypothetical protein